MQQILIGLAGILLILAVAFALSRGRRRINLRIVASAFALQAAIAVFVLYLPAGRATMAAAAHGVEGLLGYSKVGINMVFGGLTEVNGIGSFAINVLPIIIFFSALVSILYYLGIMQRVVTWGGGALRWLLGVDRVEGLYAAANVLVGQSESPLVVRGYLRSLTDAQIFALMVTGMAGVAGSILAAYAQMGVRTEYLLAAAFMSAPGGLLMAKIIMPDEKAPPPAEADEDVQAIAAITPDEHEEERPANIIMAAFNGASDGVQLAVAVGAMLIVFVALIAMANGILGAVGGLFGHPDLSFQQILGYVFAPVMFMLNVPWEEARKAGELFGEKLILNEFVAYLHFGQVKDSLSPHTQAVVTFALCGFANISSIAIQMGVLGGLVPEKRPTIARLGILAVLAGSLANLMSAALAGLLLAG
ncbi:nucleoside transporter C-terminal domain-containing protein [Caulobacter sp. NIBR1757]|uniref:NupC/NupG family nucleoside CNT transporter n=1 Tax=Caulobacter sp. NIBR1757 TaxID=3016000 RepID=UPI0022F0FD41|nr:nucleoside transporter C-terminal domain-containing protein [Caulobacter sp. NIBR1757]WGM39323.1 Putative nucleoside permease NupX [Caulobacter sp. NIBR1757]